MGPDEPHVSTAIARQRAVRPDDRAIGELAGRQHGVVALAQLRELGLRRGAIDRRLERGRLIALHRGVYAVGHASLTRHGRWMAAVLAAGPGAVLSHRAAAALWGIRGGDPLEVTTARRRRPPAGVRLHEGAVAADERATRHGIPVTSVPRTLLDLAAVVPFGQLARAAHEAEAARHSDVLSIEALLDRHPRRRGSVAVRRLLDEERLGASVTKSELEARFLAFVAARALPAPRVGVFLPAGDGLVECDCVWPDRRLVVELDSHRFHAHARAFEDDRARDRLLAVAGWRVVRVTWRQLHREPRRLAEDLRRLLA